MPYLDNRWYILGGAIITYFLFYFKKRYKKIYLRYKESKSLDDKFVRVLGFTIIVFFILLQFIVIVIYENFRRGTWQCKTIRFTICQLEGFLLHLTALCSCYTP
jgi:hypothetical protein